jgi:hypothetical protein
MRVIHAGRFIPLASRGVQPDKCLGALGLLIHYTFCANVCINRIVHLIILR